MNPLEFVSPLTLFWYFVQPAQCLTPSSGFGRKSICQKCRNPLQQRRSGPRYGACAESNLRKWNSPRGSSRFLCLFCLADGDLFLDESVHLD
jgi:hypothetical protein